LHSLGFYRDFFWFTEDGIMSERANTSSAHCGKEIVFFLTQALFQRWNGYTDTSLYEPSSLATFNTLFTSLPVIVIGIFEKDLAASTLMAVPELYKSMGQSNGAFSIWIYFGWTAMAVAESMIIYFGILILFANADATMRDNSLFPMGDLGFVAAIIVISMKLQIIEMHNKSIVAFLSILLSVGAVFGWNILLALTYSTTSLYKARGEFFNGFGKDPTWWLTLVFIVICVYLLECGVSGCRKALFPTDTDVFQELEYETALREDFERTTAAAATSRSRRTESRYSDELGGRMNEVDIALHEFQ
jgi:phospholipid-translocating ATPase